MNKYNSAFFGLYENLLKIMCDEFGEQKAINIFKKVMECGLKKSYDAYGFIKGDPFNFSSVIKKRDNFVGLKVEFPEISEKEVVYRFHTDPFPNLKNFISHNILDKTYLDFKVKYLLGDSWGYITTKHLWVGDAYSEYVITCE